MADQVKRKLYLKPSKEILSFDPHLQELILADQAGQPPNPAITSKEGDDVLVDVIARLNAGERPPARLQKPRPIGKGTIFTGKVALKDIPALLGDRTAVKSLKAATELYMDLHNSVPTVHCNPEALNAAAQGQEGKAFPGLNGSGVIVGIVDVGCDFRHANFQTSGATRLLSLWDQSDPPPADPSGANPPAEYGYGREFSQARIDQALRTADPYTDLGYTPPIAAHGTHVMDIAAGNGRELDLLGGKPGLAPAQPSHPGLAPSASLIFVHLKTHEKGFLGNSRHLLEAVDYIFRKADQLGMPAVVNVSLSTSGGPHDGTTLVEQGFEALLEEPGRAIVVSAGNAYAMHGHVAGEKPKPPKTILPATIHWHTDPRAAKNEMEVWYAGDQKLQVTLITPEGLKLGPVELGQTQDIYEGKARLGRISHRRQDPNNGDNQIDIRVPHVEEKENSWQIELEGDNRDVPFHAWIEQDDRGAASFDDPTETASTLGSICCGPKTLTVGAFDTAEQASLALVYPASAAGPTRKPKENQKPDLSAPGAAIVAARAQGGVTIMSGTSMAAAHVAGLVALLFDLAKRAGWKPLLIDTTRKIMLEAAKRNSPSSPAGTWNPRFGFGRIDGTETLKEFLSTYVQEAERSTQAWTSNSVPETIVPPSNGTNGDAAEAHLKAFIAALQTSEFHLTVESKPN